ncbi:alkylated DNA repair protein alkB homolog 8 [Megalops cyprinoides]|uniref:alkylated DNA repair protein alkB homolog 8 n=1 Tax=Megalops cyprinoides TaxID=118141 RepID=UPI001864F1B0|nr:alkylated DNA repair protein alkB homolog 8 [Megalops cyprinoides]
MEERLGENVKLVKRTKEEKKLLRKQIKASHTLLKHEGINTVSLPTKSLVVANGGLGNGVSREQLQDVLRESGCVESLLMPPCKPYAFVTYGSVEDAQRAHTSLNGRQLHCQGQSVTLYLSFVEKVGCESEVSTQLPPGLKVLEQFVSPEEEARLLGSIEWASPNDVVTAQKALKHRRVKHYGYEFRYDNNNVDKDKPLPGGLPQVCDAVLERCLQENHIDVKPDQLTINQYEPGQGIPPHVDTHSAFEDTILSLSLGAKTVMDFRHPDGRSVAVVLPARSLLVMKGESRYLWTHGITPRKFDMVPACDSATPQMVTSDPGDLTLSKRATRTSFTFRKVRRSPCDCAYPSACDSQCAPATPGTPALPRDDGDASRLETRFVHQVYEQIASHFSSTRHSPWPCVGDFLRSLPPGAVLADVGCGNGKYLGVNPDLWAVGCDRSCSLVQICADRGFQVLVSDALRVPLRDGVCDACISIAVIHHFSTQERRLAAVNELVRLLKPGGRALIYVWALEQEYNKQRSKYLKEKDPGLEERDGPGTEPMTDNTPDQGQGDAGNDDACLEQGQPKLTVHTNRTAFTSQDLLVPWHRKGGTSKVSDTSNESKLPESDPIFHRYYHVFCEGELEDLCRKVKNITIQTSYHDQGNWCVIVEKTL